MDRRSWPWKKKSSDKGINISDALTNYGENQADKDEKKTISYMQISVDTYAHLKEQEDQVKVLNEKLSAAQNEMVTKENHVKQHAKVAEEAISGWEKAEAEAAALKNQLESVTLLKLTAEERASHLDSALKECMKQIRNVKEEGEQKLQDVVFAKTKKWEEVKTELEMRIADFEQELLRASAENDALSRSLHERSNILVKVSDEKALAETEIEVLKNNIESYEREVNSLKYELHVVAKELEIRNEEKNMSMRSADAANKQHLEDVKKICKLDAECQRLRCLVQKKLPGPAALAQMKLEVENLGRGYGEPRLKRSPVKGSSMHHVPTPDFAFENIQHIKKENEFLTERLVSIEEETKMLKEALSQRNSELQASKSLYAKAAYKLRTMETQLQAINQQRSPSKSNFDATVDITMSQSESNPPSLASMSEDGIDEDGSCSGSCTTALISEFSHFSKQKYAEKPHNTPQKAVNSNHLELMDDFLEMEKLACLSTKSNTVMDGSMKTENNVCNVDDAKNDATKKQQPKTDETASSKMDLSLMELKTKITSMLESVDQETDVVKLLQDTRTIMGDAWEKFPQQSVSCIEESCSPDSLDQRNGNKGKFESTYSASNKYIDFWGDPNHALYKKLQKAIVGIHDFVVLLDKKGMAVQNRSPNNGNLNEKIEGFCCSFKEVLCNQISLVNFVLDLSHILSEASVIGFNLCDNKANEEENTSDCIDKVTLLENKVVPHEQRKENFLVGSPTSHSSAHPEIDGPIGENFAVKTTNQNSCSDEFEKLKLEKVNLEMEVASYTNLLEETKHCLNETERNMAELKTQLIASQKSNSLAETQLKCMAESYKLLESRTQDLESELNLVCTNAEALRKELEVEKLAHQEYLNKYNDLEEQLERKMCPKCSAADIDMKTKQEMEIAAAAEKLAECQATIFMLGKQLQSLHPPAGGQIDSSISRYLMSDEAIEDVPGTSQFIPDGMHTPRSMAQSDFESNAAFVTPRNGESPLYVYSSDISPSDNESHHFQTSPIHSKRPKHRPRSSSSSSLPSALPERHPRGGFSRFFSKGKGDHS